MSKISLLVHTIDNNLDNIDALLAGTALTEDSANLVGQIIHEQMNKVLENAELYYLEDSEYAKNKEQVFLIEYIYHIYQLVIEKYKTAKTYLIVPQKYKGNDIKLDEELINKISRILTYLMMSTISDIQNIELVSLDNQIHIKINLEKIEEQGLQIK